MPINLNVVQGDSFFCSGRLSVGVYVINNKAILIDSGIDSDTAKQIDSAISAKSMSVGAIINTHSHADHCGGNNYFQNKYKDLEIYSTSLEQHYIEHPSQEPTCFCGGAAPFEELRNKFLEAKPSKVTNIIKFPSDQTQVIEIQGKPFTIISLPGHTPGMIAVITPDKVLYCGDAIFGDETFNKHGVLFYTNIQDTLESFKRLSSLNVDKCVFYHGGLAKKSLKEITEQHKDKILETSDIIYKAIQWGSHSLDSLTQFVMQKFNVPSNVMQFTLTRTCVNAYVTQLQKEKKVKLSVQDGLMTISTVGDIQKLDIDNNNNNNNNHKADKISVDKTKLADFEVDETTDQLVITVHFCNDVKLTGEKHHDASILNAVECILSNMKFQKIIKNKPIKVHEDSVEDYRGIELNYNPRFLGKIKENEIINEKLSGLKLCEDRIELIFKKSKMSDIKFQQLINVLMMMGLEIRTHQSSACKRAFLF